MRKEGRDGRSPQHVSVHLLPVVAARHGHQRENRPSWKTTTATVIIIDPDRFLVAHHHLTQISVVISRHVFTEPLLLKDCHSCISCSLGNNQQPLGRCLTDYCNLEVSRSTHNQASPGLLGLLQSREITTTCKDRQKLISGS